MVRRIKNAIRRRIANFIATESAYHFLVRNWMGKADIDVMQYFFGLDFFRYQLQPVQPNLAYYKNVLLLAPHQDDESIGAGGLLQKLSKQGSNITIAYITDGAQNNLPKVSVSESVDLRFRELEQALKNIKYSIEKVNISNIDPKPSINDLQHISSIIEKCKPDLILLPWLFDRPFKHRMLNHLLVLCNQLKKIRDCEVWGFQVHNHLYPNICIDISREIKEKTRMLECFYSQNTYFKAHDKITVGMNAYNAKYLRGSDYAEIFFGLPVDKYIEVVKQTYSVSWEQVYKKSEAFGKRMKELQEKVYVLNLSKIN